MAPPPGGSVVLKVSRLRSHLCRKECSDGELEAAVTRVTHALESSGRLHKDPLRDADSMGMKLSAEQAHLAHDYLQRKGSDTVNRTLCVGDVSADIIARAMSRIAHTPDLRPDRLAQAAEALEGRLPSAAEVAERIVWRTLADSIR
jgi:hypothetical protein